MRAISEKDNMLRSGKLPGLRQAARWLKYRFSSRALLLMYHRVTDLANDPYLLAVTPKHFDAHMEVVRKHCYPMRLHDLVDALRHGRIPRRAVVVTFDDGYADNLFNAKPILEHYDIPATFFVTTGHIGDPCEFWWDELDRLLLQPGTLPAILNLRLNGHIWQWKLGEAAIYTCADFARHCTWHIEQADDPTPRQRLHRSLYQLLHTLPKSDREQLLGNLRTWSGAKSVGRPTHRTLSNDELVQLADGGLAEIGAHTVTHPMLATLPVAAQRDEIGNSRARIEEIINHPATSFAYPHGSYTQETLAIVRDLGFTLACSSDTAAVKRNYDPFLLPRMSLRNWDGDTFARWLTSSLGE